MALFNVTAEVAKSNKVYRQAGKTTNFTLIYGGAAKRVYRQVKLDLAKMGLGCPFSIVDIERMIAAYFALYPEVKQMQKDDVRYAREFGYVKSLFGRRFYLPDIGSRDGFLRSKAERKATNSPIQGTCAELLKLSIINIYNERIPPEDAVMWASVHDENVFSLNSKCAKDVGYIVHKHMAHTPEGLRTHMESELKIGPNFGNLKDFFEWEGGSNVWNK
jgi:DNA polymerase-1